MSILDLDPKTALILVDLQEAVRQMKTNVATVEIFERAAKLARAFRAHGLPVVLVTVEARADGAAPKTDQGRPAGPLPPGYTQLVPEIDAQPSDLKITKHTWGAFYGTRLHEKLKELGVTEVVIGGIATSIGVESTARAANERGYNVALVADVMADRDPQAHENSLTRIFPRLGRVGTTVEITECLARTKSQAS